MFYTLIFIILAYFFLLTRFAKRYMQSITLELEERVNGVRQNFLDSGSEKDRLHSEKMILEEEAIKIYTLYEMTKAITKTLNEQDAFAIFHSHLQDNVRFQECAFFDPDAEEFDQFKKRKDVFHFTLKSKKKKLGHVVIEELNDEDKEKAMVLCHQFALALQRVKLYKQMEQVAITDSLTNVHTRRHVMSRLQEEWQRSVSKKINLSFLMIDIDHFKSFNDQYGHLTGDQILREIAQYIQDSIREIDVPGRYGGEEFCVILPDTDTEGAYYVAERVRSTTEEAILKVYDMELKVTLSVGVSSFPQDAKTIEELIDKADWSLYKAKRSGRNRVCTFSGFEDK